MLKSALPKLILGIVLFSTIKRLLSRKAYDRDALTLRLSNIKLRLTFNYLERLHKLNQYPPHKSLPVLVLIFTLGFFVLLPGITTTHKAYAQENSVQFVLPHTGYISTFFSLYHPGIDLATDLNTPVHPIATGTVADISFDSSDYGHHVTINHSDSYQSLYGHLGKIFVKKGQSVDLSTILGEIGLTGRTSGPHTHLEIIRDGISLNPLKLLPQILQLPTINSGFASGGGLPQPQPETKLVKTLQPDFTP